MGLTPETAKFFDELEDLFAQPGWKSLLEEAKRTVYHLQAESLEAASWEQVLVNRGRAQQLAEFLNMEETAALQKAELLRQSAEEYDDANL
jgi:hypothetical protein